MSNSSISIDIVKKKIAYHRKIIRETRDEEISLKHKILVADEKLVLSDLKEYQEEKQTALLNKTPTLSGLRLGDISKIPSHILDKIHMSGSDKKHSKIIEIISELGGYACVDEILVHLYQKYEIEFDRTPLMSMLWRMASKNMLKKQTKKGYYCLPNYEEEKENLEYSSDEEFDDEFL